LGTPIARVTKVADGAKVARTNEASSRSPPPGRQIVHPADMHRAAAEVDRACASQIREPAGLATGRSNDESSIRVQIPLAVVPRSSLPCTSHRFPTRRRQALTLHIVSNVGVGF
jgi:hypothetical protein